MQKTSKANLGKGGQKSVVKVALGSESSTSTGMASVHVPKSTFATCLRLLGSLERPWKHIIKPSRIILRSDQVTYMYRRLGVWAQPGNCFVSFVRARGLVVRWRCTSNCVPAPFPFFLLARGPFSFLLWSKVPSSLERSTESMITSVEHCRSMLINVNQCYHCRAMLDNANQC